MLSVIYVSHSVGELDREDLKSILEASRRNNHAMGVTGMLLYKGGNFMQVLEGSDEAVAELYAKISKDPRHVDVTIVSKTYVQEREFPEWEMGFINMDDAEIKNMPGFSSFLQDELTAAFYRDNPTRARVLLLAFRENMR